jgi:hypothetical protein
VLTSLWQANLVGLRVERFITWGKARSTAVDRITSAAYAARNHTPERQWARRGAPCSPVSREGSRTNGIQKEGAAKAAQHRKSAAPKRPPEAARRRRTRRRRHVFRVDLGESCPRRRSRPRRTTSETRDRGAGARHRVGPVRERSGTAVRGDACSRADGHARDDGRHVRASGPREAVARRRRAVGRDACALARRRHDLPARRGAPTARARSRCRRRELRDARRALSPDGEARRTVRLEQRRDGPRGGRSRRHGRVPDEDVGGGEPPAPALLVLDADRNRGRLLLPAAPGCGHTIAIDHDLSKDVGHVGQHTYRERARAEVLRV